MISYIVGTGLLIYGLRTTDTLYSGLCFVAAGLFFISGTIVGKNFYKKEN